MILESNQYAISSKDFHIPVSTFGTDIITRFHQSCFLLGHRCYPAWRVKFCLISLTRHSRRISLILQPESVLRCSQDRIRTCNLYYYHQVSVTLFLFAWYRVQDTFSVYQINPAMGLSHSIQLTRTRLIFRHLTISPHPEIIDEQIYRFSIS